MFAQVMVVQDAGKLVKTKKVIYTVSVEMLELRAVNSALLTQHGY